MGGGGGEPRVEAHGVRAVMASASAGRGGESIGGEGAGCSTHSSLRQGDLDRVFGRALLLWLRAVRVEQRRLTATGGRRRAVARDRRLEGSNAVPVLHEHAQLRYGYLEPTRKLVFGRSPTVLLQQGVVQTLGLREHAALAKRQPDRARLVGHGPLHGSADPPSGVRRESMTALRPEAAHCLEQAERAFLHEVLHRERATRHRIWRQVRPHYRYHQPHIGRHHQVARGVGAPHALLQLTNAELDALGPLLDGGYAHEFISELVARALVLLARDDHARQLLLLLRCEKPRR